VDKEYVVVISVFHLRDIDQPHLRFYDGYSDIGARIELTNTDEPIISSTNVVYFTANRGPFRLSWERLSKEELRSNRTAEEQTRLCGRQLVTIGRSVIGFHSPGYPHGYENGLKCAWSLVPANPAVHAVLTLSQIDLELFGGENECVADYSHPPALISNGQALTISVPLQLVEEFDGHYMTMTTACGSLYNALAGKFTSPYYPASYPPNIECLWVLEATAGNSLSLTLESMDLEKSDGCNRDYLEVREESDRGELIGVYCGSEVPGVIHSRGTIWMKFKSDDDNVGEGFMASYNYGEFISPL